MHYGWRNTIEFAMHIGACQLEYIMETPSFRNYIIIERDDRNGVFT